MNGFLFCLDSSDTFCHIYRGSDNLIYRHGVNKITIINRDNYNNNVCRACLAFTRFTFSCPPYSRPAFSCRVILSVCLFHVQYFQSSPPYAQHDQPSLQRSKLIVSKTARFLDLPETYIRSTFMLHQIIMILSLCDIVFI